MTIKEMKKFKDAELVKIQRTSDSVRDRNLAGQVLYEKYESKIHKDWWKLQTQMNNSDLVNSLKDEYYSEAYEAFCVALSKIDLSKIENDNWKFIGYLDFYLTNVRTKLIKEIQKMSKNKNISSMRQTSDETSMTADPDVEEAYWEMGGYKTAPEEVLERKEAEQRCQEVIDICYSNWNESQRKIFDELKKGKSRADIARLFDISSAKVYATVTSMKNEVKEALYSF